MLAATTGSWSIVSGSDPASRGSHSASSARAPAVSLASARPRAWTSTIGSRAAGGRPATSAAASLAAARPRCWSPIVRLSSAAWLRIAAARTGSAARVRVGEVEQLVAGLDGLAAPHLHAALQVARRGDQSGVVGLHQGQVEQRRRRRDVPGGLRGQGRLQQPADAGRTRRAEPRRAFEQRQRGDVVVAGGRAAGRGGELRGHVLVGARGRRGQVEGPALGGAGPGAAAVHRGERPVRRAFAARRGRVVDRAADERVAEVQAGATGPVVAVVAPEEVGGLGRLEVAERRDPARPAPRRRRRRRCLRRRPAAARGGSPRAGRTGAARRRAPAGC